MLSLESCGHRREADVKDGEGDAARSKASDVKTRKKPNDVRDQIEDQYFDQPAGTVLPGIGKIASTVQAGRGTVEQALDQLQMEGLVVYRATKGFILTGFGIKDSIERSEVGQILEVRMSIEPLAARLAARTVSSNAVTTEGMDAFEETFTRLTDAFGNARYVKRAFDADRAFHEAIFEMCANPFLYAAASRINVWLTLNVEEVVSTLFEDDEYRRDTQNEHEAMYTAITAGEEEAAFDAARDHLANAHDKIVRRLRARSR